VAAEVAAAAETRTNAHESDADERAEIVCAVGGGDEDAIAAADVDDQHAAVAEVGAVVADGEAAAEAADRMAGRRWRRDSELMTDAQSCPAVAAAQRRPDADDANAQTHHRAAGGRRVLRAHLEGAPPGLRCRWQAPRWDAPEHEEDPRLETGAGDYAHAEDVGGDDDDDVVGGGVGEEEGPVVDGGWRAHAGGDVTWVREHRLATRVSSAHRRALHRR